jgi:CubicO group peptidase (beta-lactamase class C family)
MFEVKRIFWMALFLLGTSSCGSINVSVDKDIAENIKLPENWTKMVESTPVVIAPEGDLKIYFYELELIKDFDFSQKSEELWEGIDPSFNYKEKRKVSPPSTDGWDKVTQIVYDTPAEDSKIILSLLREKEGRGYLNLIESSVATIEKRGAQLSTLVNSWKPSTIGKKDFSNIPAKKFSHDIKKNFEEFLIQTKKDLNLPGFAVGIVQDGQVVFSKGFGKTKFNGNEDVSSDTLFMIGSTTKSLTTLLMSKLITDGTISWDDRVNSHLRGWELQDSKATELMLMKHTACACTGMPRRDFDFIFEIDGVSPEERMKQMSGMAPTTSSGETFQYSNYLVAAGGYAAAKAYAPTMELEKAFTKAIKENVFKPLGMKRSEVINTVPYVENSAYPHAYNLELKPELISIKLDESPNSVAPAGSIWSNIDDMTEYLKFELSNGGSKPGYISQEDLLLRRKKGIKITDELNYGLGLFVENKNGIEIFHHGGNTLGFTSDMFFIPSRGLGVVVLVNMGSANTFRTSVKNKLLELFFEMDNQVDEGIAFYLQESKKNMKNLQLKLKPSIENQSQLLGEYNSTELGKMNVFQESDQVVADFGEFRSVLKEINDPGENKVLVLMSTPWRGSLQLIFNGSDFVLDGGQKKYTFNRL